MKTKLPIRPYLIPIIFLLLPLTLFSQTFQWGKRGGGNNSITTGSLTVRAEEAIDIVTDANNNIYTISRVTSTGLDVDGNTRPFFDTGVEFDFVLSSFACDGTYRWSKTIGGKGYESIYLRTDGLGNIYVGGKFGGCQDNIYPPQIEGDIIIPQTPQDCSGLFLVKFDTNGIMQWFKRPQSTSVTPAQGLGTANIGLQVDNLGNSYWMIYIPPGTYADGAFVNTQTASKIFVFKYDNNGVFINATLMDLIVTSSFGQNLRFYRNAQTGQYYLTSNKSISGSASATLGSATVAGSFFIASYDANGQKLWHQEDAAGATGTNFESYDLAVDSQNNIYFAGRVFGNSSVLFMGFTVPQTGAKTYILKLNPTGTSLLWSTYPQDINGTYNSCGLAVNGSEIGYTGMCFGATYTWGTQSIFASNTNQGTEVLFGRFNSATGDCLSLVKIPGNNGYSDSGSALAVDAAGDYIIGGGFGHLLYVNGSTTLVNEGLQSDFFIAKYATSPCSTASTDGFEKDQGLNFYPNPVNDMLTIEVKATSNYTLYNIQGRIIQQGKLSPSNNTIDCNVLDAGVYMLEVVDNHTNKQVVKVFKE